MRWSSPTQLGTECIVTPVTSGPVVASDVATGDVYATGEGGDGLLSASGENGGLFRVGQQMFCPNRGIAEAARARVRFDACRFRQVLCLRHQADGLQHVKAADCAAGQMHLCAALAPRPA